MAENAKNSKKEPKTPAEPAEQKATETAQVISTSADLKTFLQSVRDKMTDDVAAPIYAMSAMNRVLNLPKIYELLDNENKEIARDIWLRLKQSGLQVRTPPMLFGNEEAPTRPSGS